MTAFDPAEYEEEPLVTIRVMRVAPGLNLFDVFEASPGVEEHKVLDLAQEGEVETYLADFENRAWW